MSAAAGAGGSPTAARRRGLLHVSLALQGGVIALVVLVDGLRHLLGFLGAAGGHWVDFLLGLAASLFLGAATAALYTRERWGRSAALPGLALGVVFQLGLTLAAAQRDEWALALFDRGWPLLIAALLLVQVAALRRELGGTA